MEGNYQAPPLRPGAAGLRRGLGYFAYFLRTNPVSIVGFGIVAAIFVITIVAPWIVPYDPENARAGETHLHPGADHWLGTDKNGFDLLSRVLVATRTDIPIAIGATFAAMLVGVSLGVITGYFGNRRGAASIASEGLLRVTDVLQAFPVFVFALALVTAAGPSKLNVGIAIAVVNAPVFLRLVRAQVLSLRERPFVEAARCAGASPLRVAFGNILPNVVAPALVQASISIGFAVLLTAGLSFIGAGVAPPTPEWGLMIANGAEDVTTGFWWTAIFPGIALAITVLGFALTGEALGRILDPTQRR